MSKLIVFVLELNEAKNHELLFFEIQVKPRLKMN